MEKLKYSSAVPLPQNFARLGYCYRSHKMTNREEINIVVLFYSYDFVATILTYQLLIDQCHIHNMLKHF